MDNSESVGFSEEIFLFNGEKYRQIFCKKTFYDNYSKRNIEAGEKGGFVHVEACGHISGWVEYDKAVGKMITEMAQLSFRKRERFLHSRLLDNLENIKAQSVFWNSKCGVKESSIINAFMYKSREVLDVMIEGISLESRIDQIGFVNDAQLTLLWTLLGIVQESLLYIHVTIFRENYTKMMSEKEQKTSKIWDLKISRIILMLEQAKDIDYEERVNLQIINGNRNRVHFLDNKSVHGYEDYIKYVYLFFETFKKLNAQQHLFIEGKVASENAKNV
jgi:hypothetical protein